MAKVAIPVDRERLVNAIRQIEAGGPLKNQGVLWKKAAEFYNRGADRPITFSVVALRVREWKIEVKTQPGKKGRQGPMTEEQKAKMQAARAAAGPRGSKPKLKNIDEIFAEQRKSTPEEFHPLLEKAQAGSKVAAVKLKCLDCAAWQKSEVAQCGILGCALYHIRPYKKFKENEVVNAEDDSEVLSGLDIESVA